MRQHSIEIDLEWSQKEQRISRIFITKQLKHSIIWFWFSSLILLTNNSSPRSRSVSSSKDVGPLLFTVVNRHLAQFQGFDINATLVALRRTLFQCWVSPKECQFDGLDLRYVSPGALFSILTQQSHHERDDLSLHLNLRIGSTSSFWRKLFWTWE